MSLELIIHVVLGNDAMNTASEAADAISRAIQHPDAFRALEPDAGVVLDVNGNICGRWLVEETS